MDTLLKYIKRSRIYRAASILFLIVWTTSAGAELKIPNVTPAKKYVKCMALARSEPEQAIQYAKEWIFFDDKNSARHCHAVALLTAGAYEIAAQELEVLARTIHHSRLALKADLFGQAGQAWLITGKIELALAAQTRALELKGPDVELLLDRAVTYASAGEYWKSIDDLNSTIDLQAERVDALVLRATAWRKLGNLSLSRDDITRALEIAPANPDVLLERGNIKILLGNYGGAKKDWLWVLEKHPNSPAAVVAREKLIRIKNNHE